MKLLSSFLLLVVVFCGCAPRYSRPYPVPLAPPVETTTEIAMADSSDREPGFLIVLDPGHGGKDNGAEAKDASKTMEKNLNLTTALYVRYYLKKFGFETAMTRRDDTFIPLKQRSSWANSINPVLFVSIHYNSAPNDKADGIEIFYFKSDADKDRSAQSKKLGESIMKNMTSISGANGRGVKHGNLAVVRETNMPAVLVEGGFISNPSDLQHLQNDVYLKKLAWGIAIGIREYVNTKKGNRLLSKLALVEKIDDF